MRRSNTTRHDAQRASGARRIAPLLIGGLLAILVLVMLWAYRAVHREPDFYLASLEMEEAERAAAADELEQRVLQLHNDARQEGQWETELTSQQINGWLAADLPEKFPSVLPEYLSDPRVEITPQSARIACRYSGSTLSSVVSVAISVQTTEEENEIAIRVHSVRAEALPLPLPENSKRQCADTARRNRASLRWVRAEDDDVALLTLPLYSADDPNARVVLDNLQLRDGSIYLTGRTMQRTANRETPSRSMD